MSTPRLLLLLALLTSCFDLDGAPYGGPGEPCWPKGDVLCEDGLTCAADGFCRTVPPDERAPCTLSTDCSSAEACDNGRCTTYIVACGVSDTDCRPDYFCSEQICSKRLVVGAPCERGAQCVSGACSDGVCCDRACDAQCESCVFSQSATTDGTCGAIPADTDPANECFGDLTCNGAGTCSFEALGSACVDNLECASTFCVDGVCCESDCAGSCQQCDAAGACVSVRNAEDPAACDDAHSAAPCPQTPCTCDNSGTCKSGGGVPCESSSTCTGGSSCVDGVCCGSTCGNVCEACVASKTGQVTGECAPIPQGSDPDGECGGATACNGSGACYDRGLGASCGAGYQCLSGSCVARRFEPFSVCCNTACSGACEFCDSGFCSLVPVNTSCGSGSACNAQGSCLPTSGSICRPGQQCLSGSLCPLNRICP